MGNDCKTTKRGETWDKKSPSNSSSLFLLASLDKFDKTGSKATVKRPLLPSSESALV